MSKAAKPETVKKLLQRYSDFPYPADMPSRQKRGVIIGKFNKAIGGDEYRHILFGWLFDAGKPLSSNDLTPQQWNSLSRWIGSRPQITPEGKTVWLDRETFSLEANWCLVNAIADYRGVSLEAVQDELFKKTLAYSAQENLQGKIILDLPEDDPRFYEIISTRYKNAVMGDDTEQNNDIQDLLNNL